MARLRIGDRARKSLQWEGIRDLYIMPTLDWIGTQALLKHHMENTFMKRDIEY